jgi:hypothetical protein
MKESESRPRGTEKELTKTSTSHSEGKNREFHTIRYREFRKERG